jgi:2',3'-cyclic-nucleotide 2'-phosphodiesterase (5'-nucleotidase family)
MVEVMNAVGFDLVTFGNHEFDLSKNELQQRLNESNFSWSSSNARQKIAGTTYPFYKERNGIKEFVSDTHIIEAKDADGTTIKIGFFSVILPSNPQSYVAYTDIFVFKKLTTFGAKKRKQHIPIIIDTIKKR